MYFPSVTGEGFAPEPLRCLPPRALPIRLCHWTLPFQSKAMIPSSPSIGTVIKMLSPQTTGVEHPLPGSGAVQRMFFPSAQPLA